MTLSDCLHNFNPTRPFEAPCQLDDIPGRFDLCVPIPDGNMPSVSLLIDTINRRCTILIEIAPVFRAIRKFADGTATYEPKPNLPARIMARTFEAICAAMQPTVHWIDRECIIFRDDRVIFNAPIPFDGNTDIEKMRDMAIRKYRAIFLEIERFGWLVASHAIQRKADIKDVFGLKDDAKVLTQESWKPFISESDNAQPSETMLSYAGFPRPLTVKRICEPVYYDEIVGSKDILYTYYIINMTSEAKQWLCKIDFGFDIFEEILKVGKFDPVLLDQRLPKFMKAFENGNDCLFSLINAVRSNNTTIILRYNYPVSLSADRETKVIADMKRYALDIIKEFIKFAKYLNYKDTDKSNRDSERTSSIFKTFGIMHILSSAASALGV